MNDDTPLDDGIAPAALDEYLSRSLDDATKAYGDAASDGERAFHLGRQTALLFCRMVFIQS